MRRPQPMSSSWPATIAIERFAGAPSRPQVAERERSNAERLDGAAANRRIAWRRPISTQSKFCGKIEPTSVPTWRPTVAADDDIDKRGVSDPPIRGGAMIATQEGGRSCPDHLFNGQCQWRQRTPHLACERRPVSRCSQRHLWRPRGCAIDPRLPAKGGSDGGGQYAPCLLSPLLAPLVEPPVDVSTGQSMWIRGFRPCQNSFTCAWAVRGV